MAGDRLRDLGAVGAMDGEDGDAGAGRRASCEIAQTRLALPSTICIGHAGQAGADMSFSSTGGPRARWSHRRGAVRVHFARRGGPGVRASSSRPSSAAGADVALEGFLMLRQALTARGDDDEGEHREGGARRDERLGDGDQRQADGEAERELEDNDR